MADLYAIKAGDDTVVDAYAEFFGCRVDVVLTGGFINKSCRVKTGGGLRKIEGPGDAVVLKRNGIGLGVGGDGNQGEE